MGMIQLSAETGEDGPFCDAALRAFFSFGSFLTAMKVVSSWSELDNTNPSSCGATTFGVTRPVERLAVCLRFGHVFSPAQCPTYPQA